MENDYLAGVIAGAISLTILITAFIFLGHKNNELTDRMEKQNKEILNILNDF